MLRTKLFRGFVIIVALFSVLSALLGIRTISRHITHEAQKRVRLDMSSAWAVHDNHLQELENVLKLVASKQAVTDAATADTWNAPALAARLARIRANFGMDFLNLVGPDGQVMLRTSRPNVTGDFISASPPLTAALAGKTVSSVELLSQEALKRENPELAERAFMELEDTQRARKTTRAEETRGLAMIAATPIMIGNRSLGAVYGGILLNRNHQYIDRICDVVYRQEEYKARPLGTATLFLYDSRVATTVRLSNGNRAIGTRVSREVADQVLDNGKPWFGEAFVVNDWYLTTYDPVRDLDGNIVGMLYVGILRKPFTDYGRELIVRYSLLSAFVLLIGLLVAFVLAGSLARPIHRLVEASHRTSGGGPVVAVSTEGACHETEELIHAFNAMTATLSEREERLKALNRSYMETLGFVSHELKSPLATMMNYVFLIREQKLGPLSEKQAKAMTAINGNLRRLVEMVRHYLNLARIENQELDPVLTRVDIQSDVVGPLLEAAELDIKARDMRVDNGIPMDLVIKADINMTREVFENLIGNAIKYGREGGRIDLRAEPRGSMMAFTVRNEGEGLDEAQRKDLFGKFARLGQAQAGKPKGTGLGLFICKHIVEAHGGSIDVHSKIGQWIAFEFTLPATHEQEARTDG